MKGNSDVARGDMATSEGGADGRGRLRKDEQWARLGTLVSLAGLMAGRGGNKKAGMAAAPEADASRNANAGRAAGSLPGMRKTWGIHVGNQPGTVFQVVYSDRSNVVDEATVARTLMGVSADRSIFLSQDSPELKSKLVPGKLVVFQGLDLRKGDALSVDGDKLVVGTEAAPETGQQDLRWRVGNRRRRA